MQILATLKPYSLESRLQLQPLDPDCPLFRAEVIILSEDCQPQLSPSRYCMYLCVCLYIYIYLWSFK